MAQQRLLTLDEVQQFLELPDETDQDTLQLITHACVTFFERLCDRAKFPFSDEQSGRQDVLDGTGSSILTLPYPVKTLTSVKLGLNAAAPEQQLVVNNPSALVWSEGSRTLERTDGGTFGVLDKPRFVHVTYDTADDRPEDAKLANLRVIAQVYRARGSEDASAENTSGYSRTMANLAATDPLWVEAVKRHARGVFR